MDITPTYRAYQVVPLVGGGMPTALTLLLMIPVRVSIFGAAVWGVYSRDPRLHVPAVLVFLLEFCSLLLANFVAWDPRVHALGSPGLVIWFLSGPLFAGSILIGGLQVAPIPILLAAALGVTATYLIWRRLWRRSRRRVWAAVAALGGIAAATMSLETSVEAMMRWDAARIQNHRDFERTSAIEMVIKAASAYSAHPHARLRSDVANYTWSFRKGGWVRSPGCEPENTAGCYELDWR